MSTKALTGHWKLLFPTEFVAAADLRGEDATVTISHVEIEALKTTSGKEIKPVIHFVEMQRRPPDKRKRWVLNKTNAKTIAKLYGTELTDWYGKRITLYPTTCEVAGETVECVRVRKERPAPPPAAQQAASSAKRLVAPPDQPEHPAVLEDDDLFGGPVIDVSEEEMKW
jgi:hypothetical protein